MPPTWLDEETRKFCLKLKKFHRKPFTFHSIPERSQGGKQKPPMWILTCSGIRSEGGNKGLSYEYNRSSFGMFPSLLHTQKKAISNLNALFTHFQPVALVEMD